MESIVEDLESSVLVRLAGILSVDFLRIEEGAFEVEVEVEVEDVVDRLCGTAGGVGLDELNCVVLSL